MIKEIKEADKIIDEMNNVTYEKAEMLRDRLEKCTSFISDISVQGSQKLHSREDIILEYVEMIKTLDNANEKIRDIYKEIKDRNLRIYFDKVYFKLNNSQLQLKYNLTKSQINKIIKNIRKNHKCAPDAPVKR